MIEILELLERLTGSRAQMRADDNAARARASTRLEHAAAESDGEAAPPAAAASPAERIRARIHPSLEVTRELLLFGFQEERITNEDEEESHNVRLLSLVASANELEVKEIDDRVFEVGEHRYVIPSRYDHPPLLEQQWSRGDLNDFVENPSAESGPDLYRELRRAVHRHIDFEEEAAEILVSLYPAISFVFPAFPAVPFLLFLGPKETGKSQALDVLSRLCHCGHKSRATAASIGDLVESQRATLLLDQADGLGEDRRDLLTDSYRAGSRRTVTNEEQRGQPHSFRIYSPKVFAAHGNFDEDLLDRCIQIPMSPAARHVEPLLADDDRLDAVRHQLYRYAALHFPGLFNTEALANSDGLSDEMELANRSWELFRPFACMFEWLDVPEGDRRLALAYFRESLPNTLAELPREREAVLRVLAGRNYQGREPLKVRSPELERAVNDEMGVDRQIDRSELGRILSDFSLVRERSRPRVPEEGRVTEWAINRQRLHRTLERWNLEHEPDEADALGQDESAALCPDRPMAKTH